MNQTGQTPKTPPSPGQAGSQQPSLKKHRATRKHIGAWIGIISAFITILAGGIAIAQFFHHVDRFEGDITLQNTADSFVSFSKSHDAQVVWLDITCAGPKSICSDATVDPTREIVLSVKAMPPEYWFHINTASTDAEADNGSYGASNLVIKGYFEVSVRGVLGAEPQNVENIFLKGVDSSTINKT